jgi:hypothetical protein
MPYKDLQKKREAGRRYRAKMKALPEPEATNYLNNKRENDRKAWNTKMEGMKRRDRKAHKLSRKGYMQQYRVKKLMAVPLTADVCDMIDLDADQDDEAVPLLSQSLTSRKSSGSRRSLAAADREKRKKLEKIAKLTKENHLLRRKLETSRTRIRRSQQSADVVDNTVSSGAKLHLVVAAHMHLMHALKRKYKIRRLLSGLVRDVSGAHRGLQKHFARVLQSNPSTIRKATHGICRSPKVSKDVLLQFFTRDDNTRCTSGKKETMVLGAEKHQIRYLLHSMASLHEKYLSEGNTPICQSTFRKGRPQFCRVPKVSDRDQCLCMTCSNLQHLSIAMVHHNGITTRDVDILLGNIVCSKSSYKCCSRECEGCRGKTAHDPSRMVADNIRYRRWEKTTNNDGFSSVQCVDKEDSAFGVAQLFEKSLTSYALHFFTFCHQYREIRHVRDCLLPGDLALHVDFSENWTCQFSSTVQASHFGHHNQIVIHQGVLYESGNEPTAFATISDDQRKTAPAVAAHLKKALQEFTAGRGLLRKLFIFSDSPSSQYRNRNTLALIMQLSAEFSFTDFEWLYTEQGHGKSSADGVGAAVKRCADNFVARGGSITDANALLPVMSQSEIIILKVRIISEFTGSL